MTVDWTVSANDVDVYLTRGNNPCSLEQFNGNRCTFLGFSASATAKPETFSVPNLAAGEYTLYMANFGSSDDNGSFQITLTSAATSIAPEVPGTARSPRMKAVLSGSLGAR